MPTVGSPATAVNEMKTMEPINAIKQRECDFMDGI
jgi:hypothetical protein